MLTKSLPTVLLQIFHKCMSCFEVIFKGMKVADDTCQGELFLHEWTFFEKYMKEKCLQDPYQQLLFKYFISLCFILKLFSKV